MFSNNTDIHLDLHVLTTILSCPHKNNHYINYNPTPFTQHSQPYLITQLTTKN